MGIRVLGEYSDVLVEKGGDLRWCFLKLNLHLGDEGELPVRSGVSHAQTKM